MDYRESTHEFIENPKCDMGKVFMEMSRGMMQEQLQDRLELWEKLTPNYNIGCKRVIISDDYFPTLACDNVTLETRPIDSVQGTAVKVKDSDGNIVSAEDDYDLVVCATGFKTVDFMHPIHLTGRNYTPLADIWKDGAKALYGMTVTDLPNFAMLYGPNTNLGHNSIILMIEAQSRYINGLIAPVLGARSHGHTLAMTPKTSVLESYNEQIQKELQTSTFNDPNCQSWYKNSAGRITNNWSRTVVEYQKMVEKVDFENFELEGSGTQVVAQGKKKVHVGRLREESVVSDKTAAVLGVACTVALVGAWALRNSRFLGNLRVR